ncbi:MAG: hypothetical protein EOO65_05350 [Methanosarcinales archaeon]|nr:MAG: hypothetical protein EOO65_05350 [Methanosarcinales archaeon]
MCVRDVCVGRVLGAPHSRAVVRPRPTASRCQQIRSSSYQPSIDRFIDAGVQHFDFIHANSLAVSVRFGRLSDGI